MSNRFSGPIVKVKRFSGQARERFSGLDFLVRLIGSWLIYMAVIGLLAGLCGLVIFVLPVLHYGWLGIFTLWPLFSLILALDELGDKK